MNEPIWLTFEDVEILHQGAIDMSGGAPGLRDADLLESALARARNQFSYGETDLFRLAAAYAEGIAANHAFVDGNKRTAFSAAITFLDDNGYALTPASGTEHADMMVALAKGDIGRDEAAEHFRAHSEPLA